MDDKPEIDGVLQDWKIERTLGSNEVIYWGNIYRDRKGRFPDGMRIHTSGVAEPPDAQGIITTRNSSYLLGREYIVPDPLSTN